MEMWRTADFEGERIVVDALVRRRSAEMALFLTPAEGFIAVPSLVVVPRVDERVAHAAPARTTEVETPLDTAIAAAVRAEEGEPVSASIAAAAAITARLNAILQDGPEPKAGPAAEEAPVLGAPLPPAEDHLLEDRPVQDRPVQDRPAAIAAALGVDLSEDAPHRAETIPAREPEAGPAFAGPPHVDPRSPAPPEPLMFRAPSTLPFARRRKKAAPAPVLVLMGLTGLGVAGAAPMWGFSVNAPGHSPIVPDAQIAGMGVGLAGVALLAASVYLLLSRLAGAGAND
jgi:lysozyme